MRLIDLARLRMDRLHVAADHVDDAGQLGDLSGVIVLLGVLQAALVAGDAAHLHGDRVVRNLGHVVVALDALQRAVHAAEEAVLQHHGELLHARRRRRREAFEAVTAEAHFAGELGGGLVSALILRAGGGGPEAGNHQSGGKGGRETRDASVHPTIFGGGQLSQLGHNFSALAGRWHNEHPVHGKEFDRVCRIQAFITIVDKGLLD